MRLSMILHVLLCAASQSKSTDDLSRRCKRTCLDLESPAFHPLPDHTGAQRWLSSDEKRVVVCSVFRSSRRTHDPRKAVNVQLPEQTTILSGGICTGKVSGQYRRLESLFGEDLEALAVGKPSDHVLVSFSTSIV
jgi:hypothetical protein